MDRHTQRGVRVMKQEVVHIPVLDGVHTGKLVSVHRQMRTGHQAGACKYTYVWSVRGTKVFQISNTELDYREGDESYLKIEWPNLARPCNNPLWVWA